MARCRLLGSRCCSIFESVFTLQCPRPELCPERALVTALFPAVRVPHCFRETRIPDDCADLK